MRSTTKSPNTNFLIYCREQLDRFFAAYPNSALEKRSIKALRLLASAEIALAGKAEGWAGGVIYGVANLDGRACGVPGVLNSDFEKFFGVSMETVRKRAANIMNQITVG
jgi:hypothetical protein